MPLLPLLLAAALAQAAPQEPRPPEFRSDVRMIRLDVSVVDRIGRAVAGLRAEDFEVREDGRAVPLVYFEAIEPAEAALGVTVTAPDADAPAPERRVLLLVDLATMSMGQAIRARESVARFLREGDWVRLANLSTGRAWDGRMPEDRERLSRAAATLAKGPFLFGQEGVLGAIQDRVEVAGEGGPSEAETKGQFLSIFAEAAGTLDTLESLIVQLGGVAGRKAIVLVSPGFPHVVGYAPKRPDDGRFRSVRVRVRSGGLAVRTKRGYLAGASAGF